jgi:hypothetical protein
MVITLFKYQFVKKGNLPTRISTIGGEGSADGQLSNNIIINHGALLLIMTINY